VRGGRHILPSDYSLVEYSIEHKEDSLTIQFGIGNKNAGNKRGYGVPRDGEQLFMQLPLGQAGNK